MTQSPGTVRGSVEPEGAPCGPDPAYGLFLSAFSAQAAVFGILLEDSAALLTGPAVDNLVVATGETPVGVEATAWVWGAAFDSFLKALCDDHSYVPVKGSDPEEGQVVLTRAGATLEVVGCGPCEGDFPSRGPASSAGSRAAFVAHVCNWVIDDGIRSGSPAGHVLAGRVLACLPQVAPVSEASPSVGEHSRQECVSACCGDATVSYFPESGGVIRACLRSAGVPGKAAGRGQEVVLCCTLSGGVFSASCEGSC